MTDPVRDQALNVPEDRAGRILAIAAGLAAAGVATGTNGNHLTGLDVTATAWPPGRLAAPLRSHPAHPPRASTQNRQTRHGPVQL